LYSCSASARASVGLVSKKVTDDFYLMGDMRAAAQKRCGR
jgi:hypothetical protein